MRIKHILQSQTGFTLIEMMVVVAITGVVMTMISAIFVGIFRNNVNVTITNEVRSQGNFLMETLARSIRAADTVTADNGSGSGDTNSIVITSAGISHKWFFCNNSAGGGPKALFEDSTATQFSSSASTYVDTTIACSAVSSLPVGNSHFNVVVASGTIPAKVTIYLTLKSIAPDPQHTEFLTTQNFTETVEVRNYVR